MIKISVNGEMKEVQENLNIQALLKTLNYTKEGFALAVNTSFIAIKNYSITIIKEGDKIDILAPVQGG